MPSQYTLSISCVYFNTELDIFEKTLDSLYQALLIAKQQFNEFEYDVFVIINTDSISTELQKLLNEHSTKLKLQLIEGHGNIGYGKANNLAINLSSSRFHLILNPDVIVYPTALINSIEYLTLNPSVCLLAPHAENQKGETEWLAKRSPSLLIILLRGLNINFLNTLFKKQLDNYCYKNQLPNDQPTEIELASGCYMFCQMEALKKVHGFSPNFFLYFEDFDLCRRISTLGKIHFNPNVKIIHFGGNTARKGIRHIRMFFTSYLKYIMKY